MMISWWIAQIAVLGALLALAAYGAESALRAAGKPTRWAWVGALLTTLALAALAPTRVVAEMAGSTPLLVTSVSATGAAATAPLEVLVTLAGAWNAVTTFASRTVRDGWSVWHANVPAGTEQVLLMVWIVASVALLTLFVAVHLRFQRRRAQWPLGTVRGTTVRIADDTGPAVIGVISAEIVVPRWLLTRDVREQQLVLAHELEHVRTRDPLLLVLAQAAIVLLPWHPAVWWMASRFRLAVELDCDRRVLQRGASARDYGTLLIDLTDHRTAFGAALPAFSCTPSHLERRLLAMTPKPLRYPLVRALTTGACASLALLAACEANLPTSAEVNEMSAATAMGAVGRVALMDTTKVTYYVNGVETTKEQANTIAPDSIASVNVVRAATGGQIRILTKNASTVSRLEAAGFVRMPADSANSEQRKLEVDVVIETNGAASTVLTEPRFTLVTPAKTATMTADTITLPTRTFTGLVMVDGVARESNAISTISPNRIVSVTVLKSGAATAKYSDPRAANGVIEITTKKATP